MPLWVGEYHHYTANFKDMSEEISKRETRHRKPDIELYPLHVLMINY